MRRMMPARRGWRTGVATDLGVDDVSDTLHPLEAFEGLQEDGPGRRLPTPARPHHHQTMVDLRDLVQLHDLQQSSVVSSRVTT